MREYATDAPDEGQQGYSNVYGKITARTGRLGVGLDNKIATRIHTKVKNLERYNNWLGKVPGAQRDDYVKLLEIVGTSKIKGLLDYVKKYGAGGLPAIALVALSPHLRDESPGNKPGRSEDRI
jgi:hypothetical protein